MLTFILILRLIQDIVAEDCDLYPVRVMNNLQGEGKGDSVIECRGEEEEEEEEMRERERKSEKEKG